MPDRGEQVRRSVKKTAYWYLYIVSHLENFWIGKTVRVPIDKSIIARKSNTYEGVFILQLFNRKINPPKKIG